MNIDNVLSNFNVFLTGGSGFIGCVILERLLQISSPKTGKIFLLLRESKKYGSIEQRLRNQIFSQKIFDHLNAEQIEDLLVIEQKVIAIKGELSSDLLGIQEKDLARMKYAQNNKPFIVIHCAADVDFKREINHSLNINVNGTFQCIRVAKCINAKAFLHISTLYVNCRHHSESRIMERIYDSGFDAVSIFHQWLNCNKKFTAKQVNILIKNKLPTNSSQMRKEWPNHYTLTKNIAEKVAIATCNEYEIPLSIARLGIVSPIRNGKHSGWFLGSGGFVFISIGLVTGNIRYFSGDGKGRPDFIPVDYTVNAMLAIVARMANEYLQKCINFEVNEEEKCINFDAENNIYQIGVIAVDDKWTFGTLCDYVTPRWHVKNLPHSPKDAAVFFINSCFLFFFIELILYEIPLFFIWMFVSIAHVFSYEFWYCVWYKFFGLEYYSDLYSLKSYAKTVKQQQSYVTGIQVRSIRMQLFSCSVHPCLRKLKSMMKAREKLKWFHNNYTFFVNQKWTFDHSNVKKLFSLLDEKSQEKYDFNVETFDFNAYCLKVTEYCFLAWLEFRKSRKMQYKEHCIVLRKKLLQLQMKSKLEFVSKFPTVEQQFLSSFRKLRYLVGIGYQWYFSLIFTAFVGFIIFYF